MHSYEAFQKAIRGYTVDIARRLRLSTSQINKWQQPHADYTDSGSLNPLDRIELIIEGCLANGVSSDEAMSPIFYLAEKFNLIVFAAPKTGKRLSEIQQELSRVTKEFGDVLSVVGARLMDGEMSKRDAEAIKKEAFELQRALAVFIARVDEFQV